MAKRRFSGGLIFGLILTGAVFAAPPTAVIIGTPPQPAWEQLSPGQRSVLAPLAKDWDAMESVRKKKWLGIADRYPTMKPDEQRRMQDRMREWARLTPEQRAMVRDSYKDFNQLPPEQKQTVKEKWKAYSNLPAEERQRVREAGNSAQLLASPPESVASESPDQPASAKSPATDGGVLQ